jgi:hypothetical protein
MSGSVGPRFAGLVDLPIGAAYLVAGLVPALVPEAWWPAAVAMAEVSLGAAVAVPLLGAAVLRMSPDPRHARRRVALLTAIVCVMLPQIMLFGNPDATPPELLAPLLPALLPLWLAAGESWPGLALERRLAPWLPLVAIVVGGMFFALLRSGWDGGHALVVLAGLTLPVVAILRNVVAAKIDRSTAN